MCHAPFHVLVSLAGAFLVTACAVPPAASEPQARTLAVEQVAGFWALAETGGPARCQLSLSNLVIDGERPVLAERCTVAAVATAKTWRATTNGFQLLDVDGAIIMAFRRTGEDTFEEVCRRYRLTRAPLS